MNKRNVKKFLYKVRPSMSEYNSNIEDGMVSLTVIKSNEYDN